MENIDTNKHDYIKNVIKQVSPLACYIPNFITKTEEYDIIQRVNEAPLPKWTQLINRRLQNWGGVPHPKGMIAEEMPGWLIKCINKITTLNIFEEDKTPNHVLINEYLPGQGIMAHSDGPLFHPIVTTISCGSTTVLEFYKRQKTEEQHEMKFEFGFLLEPRSLLVLKHDLYHNYLHSIAEREIDTISEDIKNLDLCSEKYTEGQSLNRSTRLSLTIRHVPKTSKLKLKFGK